MKQYVGKEKPKVRNVMEMAEPSVFVAEQVLSESQMMKSECQIEVNVLELTEPNVSNLRKDDVENENEVIIVDEQGLSVEKCLDRKAANVMAELSEKIENPKSKK